MQKILGAQGRSSLLRVLFPVVVLATCLCVLSLPIFPSQDGPLHLYYANIFGHLLSGNAGPYAAYFHIGSYMPPYAVYYYALLALQHVMSLQTADEVLVCCSIALVAFGFRYLAKGVGPGGEVASFLVLPVLLNWPLMMGFLNFMLSFGLGLWAAGLWARCRSRCSWWWRLTFVALLYVMAVTHPVPLALLLTGCSAELCLRIIHALRRGLTLPRLWGDIRGSVLCLASAAPACLYVHRFVVTGTLTQHLARPSLHRLFVDNAGLYLHGSGLLIFPAGPGGWVSLYRIGIGCLVVAALVMGARHTYLRTWAGGLDAPAVWFLASVLFGLLLPVMPDELNGAFSVSRRLVLLLYLGIALGVAGTRPGPWSRGMVVACVALSICCLVLGLVRIGTVARRVGALASSQFHAPGGVGLIDQVRGPHVDGLSTRPYLWAAAAYFRRHDLILYNASWVDEPQIPLKRNEQSPLWGAMNGTKVPGPANPNGIFQAGVHWNDVPASFALLQECEPALRPDTREMNWEAIDPKRDLDAGQCRESDWFCFASRSAPANATRRYHP